MQNVNIYKSFLTIHDHANTGVVFLLCRKYRFDISGISTKSTSPIESAKPTLFFSKNEEETKWKTKESNQN